MGLFKKEIKNKERKLDVSDLEKRIISNIPDELEFEPKVYHLFWDVDGVIAVYQPNHYQPVNANGKPSQTAPVNQLGAHIFKTIEIHKNVQDTIHMLQQLSEQNYKINCHILTSVNPSLLMGEHVVDKMDMLRNAFPTFPNDQIHIVPSGTKAHYVQTYLGRNLCKRDVLIDDYSQNLKQWNLYGGSAIKALNHENKNHYDFEFIHTQDHHMVMINKLFEILTKIHESEGKL